MVENCMLGCPPFDQFVPSLAAARFGVGRRRARSGACRAVELRCQKLDGGTFKQGDDRNVPFQLPPHHGDDHYSLEGGAPGVEEVLVESDGCPAQGFFPDRREQLFERAGVFRRFRSRVSGHRLGLPPGGLDCSEDGFDGMELVAKTLHRRGKCCPSKTAWTDTRTAFRGAGAFRSPLVGRVTQFGQSGR
jgi:hypothetical protein